MAQPDDGAAPTVKSIVRAAAVLRALAKWPDGAGLTEIAKEVGFGKATTHRILSALSDVGFAYQNAATRLYHLGAGLGLLSRQASRQDIGTLAQPALVRLARETEDTIYIHVREGLRSVCIGREEGTFPIKTLSLDLGQTRPLGVGSGSIALLAAFPEDEIERIINSNARWLAEFPAFGPNAVRRFVGQAKAQGFALVEGQMTPGINAIGVPIIDAQGRPIGALSVTAIAERIQGQRAMWLANLLQEEAELLSSLYANSR